MEFSSYQNFLGGRRSDFKTTKDAAITVEEFEDALRRFGIQVKPGSRLEHVCLNALDAASLTGQVEPFEHSQLDPEEIAERLGLDSFARKIVRLFRRPGFEVFVPHLEMLNNKECTPALTIPDANGDSNNKIFELLFGLVVFENSDEFVLDDPVSSSKGGIGKKPDIRARCENVWWGFECKTLIGDSPITAFERVQDAVTQIQESSVETGMPVLFLRRLVDLHEFWPRHEPGNICQELFGVPLSTHEEVGEIFHLRVCEKLSDLSITNGTTNVQNLFKDTKVLPAILVFVQGAAIVQGPNGCMTMRLTQLTCAPVMSSFSAPPLLERINNSLHDV